MTPAQEWGRSFDRALRARGYSVRRLAGEIGVHRRTVGHWRLGTNSPTYKLALRAADILMADHLATMAREIHTRACALEGCGMTFVDETRQQCRRFCTPRHKQVAARRAERTRIKGISLSAAALNTQAVKRYQRVIDAFCNACGKDACPDATCVIQVEGLSPLPLADARLRIA